jgi:hypothetical protein
MILIQFGIGSTISIGSVLVPILIGIIEFYIINTNILFLLSLVNIDKLKMFLNNIINILIIANNRNIPVVY